MRQQKSLSKDAALKFIILIGVVSLFADMTYEGARSITGPYLALLGANAAVVGFVSGFGELLGYALRMVSGISLIAPINIGPLLFLAIPVIY